MSLLSIGIDTILCRPGGSAGMRRILNHIYTGEPGEDYALGSYFASMARDNSIFSTVQKNKINDSMATMPVKASGLFVLNPNPRAPRLTLYTKAMVKTGGADDGTDRVDGANNSGQGNSVRLARADECRQLISSRINRAISSANQLSRFATGAEQLLTVDPAHLCKQIQFALLGDPFSCPLPDRNHSDNCILAIQRDAVLLCRRAYDLGMFFNRMQQLMYYLFAVDKTLKERGLSSVNGSNIFTENVGFVTDYAHLCTVYHEYCLVCIPRAEVVNRVGVEEDELCDSLNSTIHSLATIRI